MLKRKTAWKLVMNFPNVASYIAAIASLLLAASSGWAQAPANSTVPAGNASNTTTDASGYEYLVPHPTLSKDKTKEAQARTTINNILRGNLPLSDNRTAFEYFYQRHYFPMLTQTNEKALEDLPAERHRFFRDHLEQCKDPEVHQHLVDMAFEAMKGIVRDNFHPAVRFNAMMIISQLNDSEPVRVGAAPALPQPMVRALPVILEEYKRSDGLPSVRVAALMGIARHLEWDNHRPSTAILPPLRAEIIKTLIDTALLKDAPAGITAEGHEWFRRRAIEALAHTGYNKADPSVADALDKLLKDESESIPVRCSAAISIGRMAYQNAAPAKLDPQATAKELGYLALLACHEELNRLATLKKREEDRALRLGGVDGSGVTGGFGSGGGGIGGLGGAGGFSGGAGGMQMGMGGRMSRPPSGGGPSADSASPGGMRSGSRPGAIPQGEGYTGDDGLLVEDPKQYRFDPARRRMRAQIHCVLVGLTGLEKPPPVSEKKGATTPVAATATATTASNRGVKAVAKAGPEAKYVDDVITAVSKLAESIESSDVDVATLDKDVRKLMKPLEQLTKKLPTAVVTAADAPGADLPAAPGARAAAPPGAGARGAAGAGGATATATPKSRDAAGANATAPPAASEKAAAPPAAATATPPQSGATTPPANEAAAPATNGASNPAPGTAP